MPILVRNIGTVNLERTSLHGAITRNGEGEVVAGITLMLKGENSSKVIEHVKRTYGQKFKKSLPEGVVIDRTSNVALVKINTVEEKLEEGV